MGRLAFGRSEKLAEDRVNGNKGERYGETVRQRIISGVCLSGA